MQSDHCGGLAIALQALTMKILTEEEARIWHEGRSERRRLARREKADQRALAD